jgi:hypothetical protein
MKNLLLCAFVAFLFAACNKAEVAEDAPDPTPVAKKVTPAPVTQQPATASNDWMWKNAKGTPRSNDPFKVKKDPFNQKGSSLSGNDNPLESKPKGH